MSASSPQRQATRESAATGAAQRPDESPHRDEVLAGLGSDPKTLPPKLFYDAHGAALFEAICGTEEYYVTRTELGILERHGPAIARLAGPRAALIEYGSGAGVKVRHLLDHLASPSAYVPVDISSEQLREVAAERARQYPTLDVRPVCADYTMRFALPALPPHARRVAFFPGSTIGNFHPTEAAAFLHRVCHTIGRNGAMILGIDRRKDAALLDAAYNDAAGITAAFNLNLLTRLNRELASDFEVDRFRHRAFFDDETSRIEMHLESTVAQQVYVAGATFAFEAGETIHTESSYKYDREHLDTLVTAAGFGVAELWTDPREWFWVAYLTVT